MARPLLAVWVVWSVSCVLVMPSAARGAQAAHAEPRTAAEQRAARHFERIRQDPVALRAFLRAMPKGADLHVHLGGAVYAESYIQWAAELALCVDLTTLAYATCHDPIGPQQQPAAKVLQDPQLYGRVTDALSMRRWLATRGSGSDGQADHDQFFDTFRKFQALVRGGQGPDPSATIAARSVVEVLQRAAAQNIQHLELMLTFSAPPLADAASASPSWDTDDRFAPLRERALASGLPARVDAQRQWLDTVERQVRASLACDTSKPMPGCDLSLRFIASALRGLPPDQVFAQAMFAFEWAHADPRIVGVNLVMPEDAYLPMRDYDLHMRMFRFFRTLYPHVHVSLHAGELAFGLVPPEKLGLHVRQAIEIGGAERIGHGTDVMYDVNASTVLHTMAKRHIAVEISLTSSDVILGLRGARHPMRHYLRAGVPVVISTDDEGVSRSDLTNEYQRAVEEQHVSYRELKQMSRNSIDDSFLPTAEKTRLRRQLDAAFAHFEAQQR